MSMSNSRFRSGLIAGILSTIVSTAAVAGDGPYRQPFSWTGTYIGLHLGHTWTSTNVTPDNAAAASFDVSSSGFSGGALLGYNLQLQGVVLGIEGDIAAMSVTGDTVSVVGGSTSRTVVGADWGARVRGRVGVPWGPTMLFAAGGWSTLNTKVDAVSLSTPGQGSLTSARVNGYNLGVGIEHAAAGNLLLRLEYIRDQFDGVNYITSANPFFVDRATDKFGVNTIRAGASVKF